ncbi:Phage integrase family protein [Singulisphaera sp. GP187]|uniref:tyrosine-type recombinase/integrase n=1 Tax=Singulisphaera sp. GP187 TaxID=1882752 RepID=UPI000928563A|nr:site-specific integrase [Singulisphaera sp. GP187]SIO60098.1 Phage integrase family protein [Singulisphaera sp. GP187]
MPNASYSRFAAEVIEVYELKEPATLCKMRQALREVGELEGVKKTSDLKPVTIVRWLKQYPDRALATQDSLLRSFRAACSIGIASGYLRSNPCDLINLDLEEYEEDEDEEQEVKLRHHSIVAIRKILEQASAEVAQFPGEWKVARLEALVYTYAFSALRKSEALQLKRKDVDLKEGLIHIKRRRIRTGKKPKTRASIAAVPIPGELSPILERWLIECGSPWVFPGVRRIGPWTGGPPGHKPLDQIKALGERAGVDGLTILSFRHSFATHSRRWGMSDATLKSILRHTTIRTQKHYLHADADNLRAAAETVSFTP